jgi:Rrf2 family protein
MKVSAKEEYGLRCMLLLARHQNEDRPEPLSLAEMARHEGLTVAYVAKLIARLRRAGLVRSVLGRSGGYTLARDPSEISVLQVLGPLGMKLYHTDYCNRFAGDMKGCTHLDDCSMRALWGVVEGLLDRVLGQTMLSDLIGSERHALALLDGRTPVIMPIVRKER